jgi:DNA-binding response OmpR family regulator
MSNERILVVEDEQEVSHFIEMTLCMLGYTVASSANTGELAIHRAMRFKPDLVLMDINLEGAMDGIEAAKKIYSGMDVPVVFLTSLNDEVTFLRAKSAEPFGFIMKPFNSQVLGNTIEIALYQHHCSRKRAKQAAQETEEKCRATYRNAAASVIADTLQGKSVEADPVLLGILGCKTGKEFLTEAANQGRHPDAKGKGITAESREYPYQPGHLKLQTYGPDGSTTWISENKYFVRKSGSETNG